MRRWKWRSGGGWCGCGQVWCGVGVCERESTCAMSNE